MEWNFTSDCEDTDNRLTIDNDESRGSKTSNMFSLEDPTKIYVDREFSWLQFNKRVLEEAFDERNPLLERVKFLSIYISNLDEFFMIRVSGVQKQINEGTVKNLPDDSACKQMELIRKELLAQLVQVDRCWNDVLQPALQKEGIEILNYFELSKEERETLRAFFGRDIFPVLTPIGFDSGHPFPHISNLSLNLAVLVEDPEYGERFARLKIPPMFPRLVAVPGKEGEKPFAKLEDLKKGKFIWTEQLIASNLDLLFPGQRILGAYPFRITRDADLGFDEDGDKDLMTAVQQRVGRNYYGSPIRLETDYTMPEKVSNLLLENLGLSADLHYRHEAPLGLSCLKSILKISRPELKDPPFEPRRLPALKEKENIFKTLRERDILLYHPYDSFDSVIDFVDAAAEDPEVLAIKMTLYRVDDNSRIIQALMKAADYKKQVAALVELKARFDEENNIAWARELERRNVYVAYGLPGLKIHAKMCLVVRAEKDGIHYYTHMSTGNYNAVTARLYTDIGYLTSDPFIGKDISDLFNALTGYSRKDHYTKILMAPRTMRHQILERIRREVDMHKKFGNGHLIFKMNSLVDYQCIRELYLASLAGVRIDLLVRGNCCLKPGVFGLSENIRVISIVGRFLEHSRIYYFRNGGNEEILMGSADLMPRNLDIRVEILFPVAKEYVPLIRDVILGTHLKDNLKARTLLPDGRSERFYPEPEAEELDSQLWMLEHKGCWDKKQ